MQGKGMVFLALFGGEVDLMVWLESMELALMSERSSIAEQKRRKYLRCCFVFVVTNVDKKSIIQTSDQFVRLSSCTGYVLVVGSHLSYRIPKCRAIVEREKLRGTCTNLQGNSRAQGNPLSVGSFLPHH